MLDPQLLFFGLVVQITVQCVGHVTDDLHVSSACAACVLRSLRTTLCVRFKGSVTACGIIFYTARKLQVPMPDNWWELFTVKLEDMCEVCRILHELNL